MVGRRLIKTAEIHRKQGKDEYYRAFLERACQAFRIALYMFPRRTKLTVELNRALKKLDALHRATAKQAKLTAQRAARESAKQQRQAALAAKKEKGENKGPAATAK